MFRIVPDTSVLISALRSRDGSSHLVLQSILAGEIRISATPTLFLEYEAVLRRPEQRTISGLGLAEIDIFLESLADGIEGVDLHFRWRPLLKDPNDDLVMEAAINGRVDAVVTYNVKDFAVAAPMFGIRLKRPPDLLRMLR